MKNKNFLLPFILLLFLFSLTAKESYAFDQFRFFEDQSLSAESSIPTILGSERFSKISTQLKSFEQLHILAIPSILPLNFSYSSSCKFIRSIAHEKFINYFFTGTSPPRFLT